MANSQFSTTDQDLLLEIQSAAEQRLNAQLTAGLAADQRALVFAGLLAVAAAAVTGTTVSTWSSEATDFLKGLTLFASFGLIAAMSFAIYAARPTSWYYPGGLPENWLDDISQKKQKLVRLQELVADYNFRIVSNEDLMSRNAKLLYTSGVISVLTISCSLIAFVFHQVC